MIQPESVTPPVESDLDTLLNEYTQTAGDVNAVDPMQQEREQLYQDQQDLNHRIHDHNSQLAQEQFQADLRDTVSAVRGDLDSTYFNDEFVTTWLDNQARQDPVLQDVFLNRASEPRVWEAARHQLTKAFHEKFSRMPDPQLTEDRNAVAAAVRGASVKTPVEPPPNYSRSTNAEFRKQIQDEYGFDPGV